jgi:hypothetical protein
MKGRALWAVAAFATVFVGFSPLNVQSAPTSQPTSQPTLRQLQEKRLSAAKAAHDEYFNRREEKLRAEGLDAELLWRRRVLDCELELADTAAQRLDAGRSYLKDCREMVLFVNNCTRWDFTRAQLKIADYYYADAEVLVAKLERDK